MQVIDRILYKLDELVRPFVHKILVVIEPLLIDEDYYARVEGREIIANLSKVTSFPPFSHRLAVLIGLLGPGGGMLLQPSHQKFQFYAHSLSCVGWCCVTKRWFQFFPPLLSALRSSSPSPSIPCFPVMRGQCSCMTSQNFPLLLPDNRPSSAVKTPLPCRRLLDWPP